MKLDRINKLYEGKYLNYYVAEFINKENKIKKYEFVSRNKDIKTDDFGAMPKNAVAIIAFNDKGELLLEREFRLACNDWIYSFPAGLIEEGENPEDAAKRELYEETGLELYEIDRVLPFVHSAVGISDDSLCTIIGKAKGEIKNSIYVDEEIEAKWYSKTEALKLLDGNKLSSRCQLFLYMWIGENK